MPRLKAGFEDDQISLPRDADIRDDLRAIQVVKGIPKLPDGNTGSTKSGQRHGDAAIAIAMAWHATLRDGGLIYYTPAPEKASRWDAVQDDEDDGLDDPISLAGWLVNMFSRLGELLKKAISKKTRKPPKSVGCSRNLPNTPPAG